MRVSPKQRAILEFVRGYIAANGRPPTQQQIGDKFGCTQPTVSQMIRAMERKFLVYKTNGRRDTLRVIEEDERAARLSVASLARTAPVEAVHAALALLSG